MLKLDKDFFLWSFLALAFSAISLVYELVYAHFISFYTGDISFWYSISIGSSLAGIGLGVLSYRGWVQLEDSQLVRKLFYIELALSLFGTASIVLLMLSHMHYRIQSGYGLVIKAYNEFPPVYYWAVFALSFPFVLGLLSGFELNLLLTLGRNKKISASAILCFYNLGALLGTGAFIFFLLPSGLNEQAPYSISLLNVFLAASLCFFSNVRPQRKEWVYSLIAVGCAFLAFRSKNQLINLHLFNHYHNQVSVEFDLLGGVEFKSNSIVDLWQEPKNGLEVERMVSNYQTLDFVYDKNKNTEFKLYINGRFQLDSLTEEDYHKTMLQGLKRFDGYALKIAILGGGDGLLARSILENIREPSLSIDLVEIDSTILESAQYGSLSIINSKSLSDPRVQIHRQDAWMWLKNLAQNSKKYEVIFCDFPYPYDYEGQRLYSYEMWRRVHAALVEGGVFMIDWPLLNHQKNQNKAIALATASGFTEYEILYSQYDSFLLMTKTRRANLSPKSKNRPLSILTPSRPQVYDISF